MLTIVNSQGACVTVAALLQYFLMAAFCWMLVEGIYLFLLVVKAYNIKNKMFIYHVMSWGKFWKTFFIGEVSVLVNLCYSLLFMLLYCRFSRCCCHHVSVCCCRKWWDPQFRRWRIVSIHYRFPSLFFRSAILLRKMDHFLVLVTENFFFTITFFFILSL